MMQPQLGAAMSFLEDHYLVGYVLLVALAALIMRRFRSARRQAEDMRSLRLPQLALREASGGGGGEGHERGMGGREPRRREPMPFGRARLQFYLVVLAAIALLLGYLFHK
jgi:hypothetical protein